MSGPSYVLNIPQFRVWYPEFSDSSTYDDDLLNSNFDFAGCYLANSNYGWLTGPCRYRALTLMTAHLTKVGALIAAGQVTKIVTGATIREVVVTLQPPPVENEWRFWLNTTEYGKMLLVMLQAKGVGGIWVAGLPELAPFKRVGGAFVPPLGIV